jgi:hypothetical protein
MIRLDDLLDMVTPDGDLSFDGSGVLASWADKLPEPAVVYVDDVTDAVKSLSANVIRGSLDRGQVWEVVGFKVAREVAAAVGSEPMTAQDFIVAVRDAGFEWTAIRASTS